MKQPLKKTLVVIMVLVFTIFTMTSCGSKDLSTNEAKPEVNTWDSIQALPEGMQPTVLPKAENLNAYPTLRSFASITSELKAQTSRDTSGNSDTLSWNPESCWAAASYVLYDATWEVPNSEFAQSLGQGWEINFLDGEKGSTVAFSIFSDLGVSDRPLIDILERDIKACPIAIQKIGDVTWNYEFQVRRDSENTITIIATISNSQGLVGNSLRSINQVGRNLLASYLVNFDWDGNMPPSVSEEQEKDLISAWLSMATKVIAQQG